MKARLLQISLSVFLLVITGCIMATPHTQPVRILLVDYASHITIDGEADDRYSAPQSTTAFNVTGSTGADADFTGTFQVCLDQQRLYILATILDDYACEIPYTTSINPWTWDNVEVFISLDTTGTTPAYDTNTIQLRFNRGIQDSAQTPGRADQSEYDGFVYSENTATGWILEVGIPWTAVLSDGQLPEDIDLYSCETVNGFDVSFADNDTDGPDARDCQTAWDDDDPAMPDATEDLAWNNRTMFGVMQTGCGYAENLNYQSEIIYPNPASNQIQLQNTVPNSQVKIYDMLGAKVIEQRCINDEDHIDISSLKTGLYTVIINDRDVTRFVKE